jgi:nucleotide-binding universal stress UspA family protein
MQKILVPTDFSANSALAFQYALHIASESGLEIHLVHVYELPLLERYLNEEVVKTISDAERDELFRKFIDNAVVVKEDIRDLVIKWTMREGNVSAEIEKHVREIDPLLIIMGSQGSGSDQWDKLIIGGTAQKIVRRMIIPVMLVPPEAQYKPLRKIAFATDFGAEDADIIDELLGFARHFNAKVLAVHIQKDKWDVHESRMEHFRNQFAAALEAGSLELKVYEDEDVMQGLDKFVQDHDISLLALLKKYHNLWDRLVDRSMAIKIALHAHIPSIVFKEV